jgi:hypothetical protein
VAYVCSLPRHQSSLQTALFEVVKNELDFSSLHRTSRREQGIPLYGGRIVVRKESRRSIHRRLDPHLSPPFPLPFPPLVPPLVVLFPFPKVLEVTSATMFGMRVPSLVSHIQTLCHVLPTCRARGDGGLREFLSPVRGVTTPTTDRG